jgi:hypothetical protein
MGQKRESRYVCIARLAYVLARRALPAHTHRNSRKTYTQPQLAACVLMMFYMDLSYRDMEEWLLATEQVCAALELTEVPDHTTLYRMYERMRVGLLDEMNAQLLEAFQPMGETVAVDATGYSFSQASLHFITASGRRSFGHFMKGYYVVDTQTQLILAWTATRAPSSDMAYLDGLRHKTYLIKRRLKHTAAYILLGDRGFDGKDVHPGDLIPPRTPVIRPDRLLRRELVDSARLDGIWGQRWISETVHSVIKRKSGSTIRSRLYWHQFREPLAKGLVYNLHR